MVAAYSCLPTTHMAISYRPRRHEVLCLCLSKKHTIAIKYYIFNKLILATFCKKLFTFLASASTSFIVYTRAIVAT